LPKKTVMDSLSISPSRYLNLQTVVFLFTLFLSAGGQAQSPTSLIWINLSHEQDPGNQILVGYTEMTTMDVDPGFDALLVPMGNCLSSLIGSDHYVIQARPPFEASDIVPLGFHADSSGAFAISIDHTTGVFEQGQPIFLYDSMTSKLVDLSTEPYLFTSDTGDFDDRFQLVYQSSNLSLEQLSKNNVSVYTESGVLTVNTGDTASEIQIFDLTGKQVAIAPHISGNITRFPNLENQHQTRIVCIVYGNGQALVRKIVF